MLSIHGTFSLYIECDVYRYVHTTHTRTHQVGTTVGEPLMLYDGAVTGKLIEVCVCGLCVRARVCACVCIWYVWVCKDIQHTACFFFQETAGLDVGTDVVACGTDVVACATVAV